MLHRWVTGSGQELFLLHGWGMNGAVWESFDTELSDGYRITVAELPGHGRSPYGLDGSLGGWAEACLEAAPERAVWIGWSLGGNVALEAALEFPQRITALALVTTTPRFTRSVDWQPAMPPETLTRFHNDLMNDPRATLDRFLALEVRGDDQARAVLRQLRSRLAKRPTARGDALDAGLDLLRNTDQRQRLPKLSMPNMWLFGKRDALVPRRCADAVAELLPSARIELIDGAAHAPFLSHPAEAIGHLRHFLETGA